MNGPSLRLRVTAWYIGLLAAALLIFCASLYVGFQRFLFHSLQKNLADNATNIAESFVSQAPVKGDHFVIGEVNESYAPESTGWFIRIFRPDHSLLYQSEKPHNAPWTPSEVPAPLTAPSQDKYRTVTLNGDRLVLYQMPYRGYTLQVGSSSAPQQSSLRSLLFTLLFLTPLTLIAAALGGYLLMRQPLKPLVALTEQAEHIGVHHLGQRLPVIRTGDELERLSLSLNRMIGRLEESLAHNSRFSADVSHELRTPLTILRGELEHVIQLAGLDSEVSESIGSALEEIDRMSKIVASLLTISKLDAGAGSIALQPVQLAQLAFSTADQMALLAEEKRVSLTCQPGADVTVMSDPVRLKQILVNLLDNAIKYTPSGGSAVVSWKKTPDHAVLMVEDTGQGIAPDELPHVYERFYRTDKARTSGGAGLGLSIVKAIATAIQANVVLTSRLGHGTISRVEIPLWDPISMDPANSSGVRATTMLENRSSIEYSKSV